MKLFHFLFCSFFIFNIYGQTTIVQRIEFASENQITQTIPFGNNGLLYQNNIEKKAKQDKNNTVNSYTLFNTNLDKVKTIDVKTPKKYSVHLESKSAHKFFEIAIDKHKNYIIHAISIPQLDVTSLHGKLPKNLYIHAVESLDDYIFIKASTRKFYFIFIKNMITGEESFTQYTPVSAHDFNMLGFKADSSSNELYIIYRDKINNEITTIVEIYTQGKKSNEFIIPNGTEKFLLNGSLFKTKDNAYILCGTFGNSHKDMMSVGIYICKLKHKKIEFIQFVNYLDIKNFMINLPEKKQERIIKRKEKKEKKGNDIFISYMIAPHKIIEYNNEYILIAEAFYPTYKQECYTVPTGSGGTTTQCTVVFNGYEYTHYFIYTFDQKGNPIWSNTKKMNISYKPFRVETFVNANITNNNLVTLYGTDKEFYYTAFNQKGEEISSETHISITSENESESIKKSSMITEHWYDNFFIAYGFQKIKNTDEKEKRNVFFINKIEVKP
ncbi:MAG TPA: hypothetical protein P5243_05215 [Bacteroidales bacterium]|jgi:hypothetical protein|nr:hypothetical protein [Bacteroidales bacterium]